MTKGEVAKLLAIVAVIWPRQFKIPDDKEELDILVSAWHLMLGDVPFEVAQGALVSKPATWPPSPIEVRDADSRVVTHAVHGQPPTVGEAWHELEMAVRRHGSWSEPSWSHELVASAVSQLGYKAFCMSNTSDVTTWRAQFRDIYNSALEKWYQSKTVKLPYLEKLEIALKQQFAGELEA